MRDESDFVRMVSVPGDRYNVVIGYLKNEVIVGEAFAIGPAEALVVKLRGVIGGCIDVAIESRRQQDERLLDLEAEDTDTGYAAGVIDTIDSYMKERTAKGSFSKCCRATANAIKSVFRGDR
jgi:hypothetical protein